MQVFDVYQHPVYGCDAVQRGFSWSAFLMPSVWAVRRGLGWITLFLVAASTLVFDIVELARLVAPSNLLQFSLLGVLIAAVGLVPGFIGYRWHADRLKSDNFIHKCTIVATGRRQAIRAANDDRFTARIRIAAA